MENKALLSTLVYKLDGDLIFKPVKYQCEKNIRYCDCFGRNYNYYREGLNIDYYRVDDTILCPQHMTIYTKQITEARIEKMEKTLDTILSAIKYITYRVDRDKFEPEMNELLGNITSEAGSSNIELNGDKKE